MLQIHDIPGNRISPKKDAWEEMKKMGYFRGRPTELADLSWVNDMWKGQPAFVIGTSPGLKNMVDEGFTFDMLDGLNTISCNHFIEDYDRIAMHLFLDQHFLDTTPYDLKKYKGKLFARNNTNIFKEDLPYEFYRFMAKRPNEEITMNLNEGIYSDMLSGLCCMHILLVTGANPIYIIGMDTGGTGEKYHYKDGYKGEFKINTMYKDAEKRNNMHKPFAKYADRIVNVDPVGVITHYPKIDWKEIPEFQKKK